MDCEEGGGGLKRELEECVLRGQRVVFKLKNEQKGYGQKYIVIK